MKIRVQLMGILEDKRFPEDGVEFEDGMTIREVLAALGIRPDAVHACTVNGTLIRDRDFKLSDGDELTVLPPVVGG